MGTATCRLHSLSMARAVLCRSVPDRLQAQPVADGAGAAALYARARSVRRTFGVAGVRPRVIVRELRASGVRLDLPLVLSAKPRDCADLDDAAAADRLSDRLRDGARAAPLAAAAVHADRAAVLDVVPDPRLCLDDDPAA